VEVSQQPDASRRVGRQGRTPAACVSGRGGVERRRLDLHSTGERRRALADAVGKVARSALRQAKKADGGKASGTKVARNRKQAS
jgi:hypothetical protein